MATAKKQGSEADISASKIEAREAFEKLLEAKAHFREAARSAGLELKEEALDELIKGSEKAEDIAKSISEYAREKPINALAFAFIGGYLLSQVFFKR
jgi:uncharacterized protein YjgD (DUF1641 family)